MAQNASGNALKIAISMNLTKTEAETLYFAKKLETRDVEINRLLLGKLAMGRIHTDQNKTWNTHYKTIIGCSIVFELSMSPKSLHAYYGIFGTVKKK